MGIIFQSISTGIIGLIFGFIASWKLTLVVLSFTPLIFLSNELRGRKKTHDKKITTKKSFVELGGQV